MSSTILTNKAAAAFRHPVTGKVIYALFGENYESNVTPKTPDWSCFALGEYADVMKVVFNYASACEGGCLRSRAGEIKPENLIYVLWAGTLRLGIQRKSVCLQLG